MTAPEVLIRLRDCGEAPIAVVGAKAHTLGRLMQAGVPGVDGHVVPADVYRRFVDVHGLADVATAEIERRARTRARAEEYWDSALRIRAAFVAAEWPPELRTALLGALGPLMGQPLVVRSSASHLDGPARGLVRMHDSVRSVQSSDDVLAAIKWVWSSLFSDRALLYGCDIGLNSAASAMAVILQPEFVPRASGVAYTRHPSERDHLVIDAVEGREDQLASGLTEPHTWVLDRTLNHVLEVVVPQSRDASGQPPLHEEETVVIGRHAMTAEQVLGEPQACEFAVVDGHIVIVECRAVDTPPADERRDYLAVRLPESRLEKRRARIESEFLPSMWSEANALSVVDVPMLDDRSLVAEASRRAEALAHWRHIYRTVMAPFAHGQRLFGEYFVRMTAPEDAFAFVPLLVRTPEEYELRRQIMAELGVEPPPPPVTGVLRERTEAQFLERVPEAEQEHALWLLDLARASWSMRDDDNLYLQRIEKEARRAYDEILTRLEAPAGGARSVIGPASRDELERAARHLLALGIVHDLPDRPASDDEVVGRPMTLHGDPASPGTASGRARIIKSFADAREMTSEDVLVVDELDPEIAAYAAKAAAVVEGRGGMFAHSAVLAREYGLPCVTGIPEAARAIRSGEQLEVDGSAGTVRFVDP